MELLALHDRAQRVFADVVKNVRSDQLSDPTPCTRWSVGDLVGHVISANDGVADHRAEETDPTRLPAAHQRSAERAAATFDATGGLSRVYDLSVGPVSGAVFIRMRITDVLMHAWDLARATGQPTDLDPELATEVLSMARELVRPQFRGPDGPFGDEQPCPPGRPEADRLAAFLGRPVT